MCSFLCYYNFSLLSGKSYPHFKQESTQQFYVSGALEKFVDTVSAISHFLKLSVQGNPQAVLGLCLEPCTIIRIIF